MIGLNLLSLLLALTRVSAFLAFFPLFGRRQVPFMVKAGLATAMAWFWQDSLGTAGQGLANLDVLTAILLLAREFGIGFVLAMTLGFVFVPARIAGAYVGQELGLSLAAISDPDSTDNSTVLTVIFEALALLVFFALDLHQLAIIFLHLSMTWLADQISLLSLPTEDLSSLVNELPEYGLLIIAPIGICMFLLTVGLSLLNKAAPTLNLFSVGMSLRSGLGIACLLVFMPVIIQSIRLYVERFEWQMEQFLGFFL